MQDHDSSKSSALAPAPEHLLGQFLNYLLRCFEPLVIEGPPQTSTSSKYGPAAHPSGRVLVAVTACGHIIATHSGPVPNQEI
jgi:hypothetical protein